MNKTLVYGMTDNPGGIETYLVNFLLRQQRGVFDFVSDFPDVAYRDKLEAHGSVIYHISAKSRGLVSHWRAICRILREHPEYQTVYMNGLDAGMAFTALVPWLMGRRVVVHSHNDSTEKLLLHRLCRPCLKVMAKGYVACSQTAASYMFGRSIGQTKTLLIPNVIDARAYTFDQSIRNAKRIELGLANRLVILHVGRISFQKNPFFLIDIFEAVHSRRPDAVLVSVGTGELDTEFDEYIEKKELGSFVIRLGRRSDVAGIMQAADVFLFPSKYEGFGIAALEAQAAGLACVLSDTMVKDIRITKDVTVVSLNDPIDRWADAVLAHHERRNTYTEICRAGYDLTCVAENDKKLRALITTDT